MDEQRFKQTYGQLNDRPCVFAKAVLRRCCGCTRAQRIYIAEREAVACLSPAGQERCQSFVDTLREKARFALHLTHSEGQLPHGKELKVQCGGLLGLHRVLSDAPVTQVADVNGLLDWAIGRWGSVDALPYSEIMPAVVHYEARPGKR